LATGNFGEFLKIQQFGEIWANYLKCNNMPTFWRILEIQQFGGWSSKVVVGVLEILAN
jgi:hypothetical protein